MKNSLVEWELLARYPGQEGGPNYSAYRLGNFRVIVDENYELASVFDEEAKVYVFVNPKLRELYKQVALLK